MVKLSELVVGLAFRGTPLQAESALFVALQAAESLHGGALLITAEDVLLDDEGGVVVQVRTGDVPEVSAVREVAGLIPAMLESVPGPVRAMVERARDGQIETLAALRAEIEGLLVPLNRPAARRMLGRLVRDQRRYGTGEASRSTAPSTASASIQGSGATDTVFDPSVTAEELLATAGLSTPPSVASEPPGPASEPPPRTLSRSAKPPAHQDTRAAHPDDDDADDDDALDDRGRERGGDGLGGFVWFALGMLVMAAGFLIWRVFR